MHHLVFADMFPNVGCVLRMYIPFIDIQYFKTKRDQQLLENVAADPRISFVTTPQGYKLAVRFIKANANNSSFSAKDDLKDSNKESSVSLVSTDLQQSTVDVPRHYPIVIPNGLAATMATIGDICERLVAQGFTVLAYDRYIFYHHVWIF